MVAADPAAGSHRASAVDPGNGAVTLTKALSIVEFIAEREGASAREIAVGVGIPLTDGIFDPDPDPRVSFSLGRRF